MKEQRKIPLTHIMIIGAFIFAFLQVVLLASLVHAVNVNNEIQEGLFQSGRQRNPGRLISVGAHYGRKFAAYSFGANGD
ncbi:hypothetical protein LRN78_09570 [Escherichia coli]|nr:hypothetical protein [Escherichia coli]MCF1533015.1 hypothetical protein [Escherichia coli]